MKDADSVREKFYRVQFDFTAESLEELTSLKSALQLKTKADVIRYAMRVLQWMVEQAKSGNPVLVEKDGRIQEVIFPFLPQVSLDKRSQQDRQDKDREYTQRRARELRERAEEIIERSKGAARREEATSAIKAGLEAYPGEKATER